MADTKGSTLDTLVAVIKQLSESSAESKDSSAELRREHSELAEKLKELQELVAHLPEAEVTKLWEYATPLVDGIADTSAKLEKAAEERDNILKMVSESVNLLKDISSRTVTLTGKLDGLGSDKLEQRVQEAVKTSLVKQCPALDPKIIKLKDRLTWLLSLKLFWLFISSFILLILISLGMDVNKAVQFLKAAFGTGVP